MLFKYLFSYTKYYDARRILMKSKQKDFNDYKPAMGQRLRKRRLEKSLTQENMAELLDISVKHYSEIERGITGISVERLIELSDLLDLNIDYLLKGNNNSDALSPFLSNLYTQCPSEKLPHLMNLLQNLSKLI